MRAILAGLVGFVLIVGAGAQLLEWIDRIELAEKLRRTLGKDREK